MFEEHTVTSVRGEKKNYHKCQGSRAQLKQTLISNMVTSNETINQHLNLSYFSIRSSVDVSVWLLISGAGDVVCGVV